MKGNRRSGAPKLTTPHAIGKVRETAADVTILIYPLTVAELAHGIYRAGTPERSRMPHSNSRWTTTGVPDILKEVADHPNAMTIHAHFDGKVIVPDEPIDLRPNQPVIVRIEPLGEETDVSALEWIDANAVDSDALPLDLAHQHDHYLYGRPKKDNPA